MNDKINPQLVIDNLATANAELQKENAILQAFISELREAIAQQESNEKSSNEI